MPFCLRCRFEYREGLERCPECGAELAEGPLPDQPGQGGSPPTAVWQATSPLATAFAQLQLEKAGIPCATSSARAVIYVPAERAQEAEAVLSSPSRPGEESIFLSQISGVKLACATCERVRRVDLAREEIPLLCTCGRAYDFGPALNVLERLRALVREVQSSDFDVELEIEQEPAESDVDV